MHANMLLLFFAKVFLYNTYLHTIFPFNNKFNCREGERGIEKQRAKEMKNLNAFPDVLRFLEQKTLGCIHVVFVFFLHTHTTVAHTYSNTHAGCMHMQMVERLWSSYTFFSTRLPDLIAQLRHCHAHRPHNRAEHTLHYATHNLICSCNCFGPYGRDGKSFELRRLIKMHIAHTTRCLSAQRK